MLPLLVLVDLGTKNKGGIDIPQSSRAGASASDGLVSYAAHS